MTTVRAGGKDVILPGDGFDAFFDFVFNTPSQPELCRMKKEDIVAAIRIEPTVAAANDASTQKKETAAPLVATLSSRVQKKEHKQNPKSNPSVKASSYDNAGTIAEHVQKAKHDKPTDGEQDGDDDAYRQPYLLRLSSSYLESIKKQSLRLDYSDSLGNMSEVEGDSSAWSFSAVGADDDTYASIEDASNANVSCDITAFSAASDTFHNVMRFEEKVQDESDEQVVKRPYFLKSSSSYLESQSEKSGQDDGNASTWSFSAV